MFCDLLVRGTVVTPAGPLAGGWVAITGESIAAVGSGAAPESARYEDFGAALVFPGFIDGQVHACSYGGLAGLESTTRAALAGGITTIVDMPYDNPDPLNDMERLVAKREAIGRLAHADVALYGTVAPGQGTAAMAPLAEAGIAAFKLSAFESHPVRFPRIGAGETHAILSEAATLGLPVGLHNEDQEIVRDTIAAFKAAGRTTAADHAASRPEAAELAATAQFLELGAATGAHVHIVHFSTARGFDMVADYRARGVKATAEMCVHYLHFDGAADMARLGARLKVNPPIRPAMIERLWRALDGGLVAFTSSDHSSWPIDNKLTENIFDAGAGIPGLETLVPSFATDLMARGEDMPAVMLAQLCEGPARFFGLWPQKGAVLPGADADLTVLRSAPTPFSAAGNHDGLNWSPYDGETFQVAVAATFLRGRKLWDGAKIAARPGDGRYVARRGPSIFA